MPGLHARARYFAEIEVCPNQPNQIGKCEGILNIYAYLDVRGEVEEAVMQNGIFSMRRRPIHSKILPQKVRVKFMLVPTYGLGSSLSAPIQVGFEVKKCEKLHFSHNGDSPVRFTHQIGGLTVPISFIRPTLPTGNVEDVDKCISGSASFSWVSGLVTAAGNIGASASTSAIPVAGAVNVNTQGTGGVGVGGTPYPLMVSFKVCHGDGCELTDEDPVNRESSAKDVFAQGGIFDIP